MTRNEAVILLIWCGSLANKLAAQGLDIELTKEDQVTLRGFSKVWASGLLRELILSLSAGLNRSDIEMLTAKMVQEVTKRK